MEYLEGETLAQRLQKGALPLAETLRLSVEKHDLVSLCRAPQRTAVPL